MPGPRSRSSPSVASVFIVFTVLLIGFLLCFLLWAVVKHFSNRAARRRRAHRTASGGSDPDEESGNDGFSHQELDGGSKILIVRKSYRPAPPHGHDHDHNANAAWAADLAPPGRAHPHQHPLSAAQTSPGMSRNPLVSLDVIAEDEEKAEEDSGGG